MSLESRSAASFIDVRQTSSSELIPVNDRALYLVLYPQFRYCLRIFRWDYILLDYAALQGSAFVGFPPGRDASFYCLDWDPLVLQSAAFWRHLQCKTAAEGIISASHLYSCAVRHTIDNKDEIILPRRFGKQRADRGSRG